MTVTCLSRHLSRLSILVLQSCRVSSVSPPLFSFCPFLIPTHTHTCVCVCVHKWQTRRVLKVGSPCLSIDMMRWNTPHEVEHTSRCLSTCLSITFHTSLYTPPLSHLHIYAYLNRTTGHVAHRQGRMGAQITRVQFQVSVQTRLGDTVRVVGTSPQVPRFPAPSPSFSLSLLCVCV